MFAALAVLVAAGIAPPSQLPSWPAQKGPWLEIAAGPALLHQSGARGVGTGPLVRLGVGKALSDATAAEVWLSGGLQSGPLSSPGDAAVAAAGLGGRLRLHSFGEEGKLAVWARVGAGWQVAAAGDARSGPAGFAGALLLFQPFVRRFAVGLEVDALAARGAAGFAVLPSLRCAL
ncbi:MAG: hypothetical protein NVSMB23_29330 [Myxococcales bacterium]